MNRRLGFSSSLCRRMRRRGGRVLPLALLALGGDAAAQFPAQHAQPMGGWARGPQAPPRLPSAAAPLRAALTENRGQLPPAVRFHGRIPGAEVFFTSQGVVYSLRAPDHANAGPAAEQRPPAGSRPQRVGLRQEFVGAAPAVALEAGGPARSRRSFFVGADPAHWRTGVPDFEEILYRGIYPGVDLLFRIEDGRLKSLWRLQPGCSADSIRWRYEGCSGLGLAAGALQVHTSLGVLEEGRPSIFQMRAGERVRVRGGYRILDEGQVGFWVGAYDPALPLIVDPSLEWSTFLGGSGNDSQHRELGLAVDATGCILLAGATDSPDFPLSTGPYQTSMLGRWDAWVAKLDPSGSRLLYASYLGSIGDEFATDVSVDAATGILWLTGRTTSATFPTTAGAFQAGLQGDQDAFVVALDPSAVLPRDQLLFSTYLGGPDFDYGRCVETDAAGWAWIAGGTRSAGFPVTAGAFDPSFNGVADVFLAAFELSGPVGRLAYSTFLGGEQSDQLGGLAVDARGRVGLGGSTHSRAFPVTGNAPQPAKAAGLFHEDAFASLLDPAQPGASALLFSTYLGGGGSLGGTGQEQVMGAAISGEHLLVTGFTNSSDFPVTAGAFQTEQWGPWDAFIAKLDPLAPNGLGASGFVTLLGGRLDDQAYAIAATDDGRIAVTGWTFSADFPITAGAFARELGQPPDAFVSELDPSGRSLVYSSLLGSSGADMGKAIAWDRPGPAVLVAGSSDHSSFPTRDPYQRQVNGAADVFLTKMRLGPVLRFHGEPVPGALVRFSVESAPSDETGSLAQVLLSCAGTDPGKQLAPDLVLPLRPDLWTRASTARAGKLQGVIGLDGRAVTPMLAFPPLPVDRTLFAAAFTWSPAHGAYLSVTPPIRIGG